MLVFLPMVTLAEPAHAEAYVERLRALGAGSLPMRALAHRMADRLGGEG